MYTIGEMARLSGVKVPTIRYYEQVGLVPPPERTSGNQRRYSSEDLARVRFIRHARELGFSLGSVGELIALDESSKQPCDSAHDIARKHLESVRHRLSKLRRLEVELKRISSACNGAVRNECYVMEALADHTLCRSEH